MIRKDMSVFCVRFNVNENERLKRSLFSLIFVATEHL